MEADLRALKERLAAVSDLARAGGVLGWDQRVTMPPQGGPARAEALGTIGRIAHDMLVDDEFGSLLERLRPYEESLEYDSDDASLIRVTRRDWEKARRVPARLLSVGLSHFSADPKADQLALFEEARVVDPLAETEKDRAVARTVDKVREKFGAKGIIPAGLKRR